MSIKTFRIETISGGISATSFGAPAGSYMQGLGIDPDLPLTGTEVSTINYAKTGGAITPSVYGKFSSTNVNTDVIKIITQPKLDKSYAILRNGRIVSYDNAYTNETLVGTVAGGNAEGADYYNNYIYIFGTGTTLAYDNQTGNFTVGQVLTGGTSGATGTIKADTDGGATGTLRLGDITGTFADNEAITDPLGGAALANGVVTGATDVSRYGPLDGAPAITNGWWAGRGLTALGNPTYPSVRGLQLFKHWSKVHVDGRLYFCDYVNGQGYLNSIVTKYDASVEGKTDNGSTYQILKLPPFGYIPTCIESFGTDLAITGMVAGTSTVYNQGKAQMFLWDTFADIPYNQVALPDPLATCVFSAFSVLHIFTGNVGNGFRVSTYSGGLTVSPVVMFEEGYAPFPGAVDALGDRISFGSYVSSPTYAGVVFSLGSKDSRNQMALHCTVRASAGGSVSNQPFVTALKYAQQQSLNTPRVFVAWDDGAASPTFGIDKLAGSGSTTSSMWISPLVVPGKKWTLNKVSIPLAAAPDATTLIQPSIFIDGGTSSASLPDINISSAPNRSNIVYKNPKMSNGTTEISGSNNFYIKLLWNDSSPISVIFPIEIEVDVFDDEPSL